MPSFVPFPIPTDPDACPSWLNEALRRLRQAASDSTQGAAAIVRGEAPDGSGNPIVDLTKYFYKPGVLGGQIGYGGTSAGEDLTLGSTVNASKGFIYLGTPTPRLSVDEAQSLVGINKAAPSATLHIVGSLSGSGSSITPTSDINTNWEVRSGASWTNVGGPRYTALATDDGETLMATVNSTAGGVNPQWCGLSGTILPGGTYTVTLRVISLVAPTTFSLALTLIDSAGNGWATAAGTDGVLTAIPEVVLGRPTFYTVTFTISCFGTPALTGSTANSIRIWGASFVGASETYLGVTSLSISQTGAPLVRWDHASGGQSGGVDLAGRLGVGTGSATLDAEVTVVPDAASTVGLKVSAPSTQTGNLVQLVSAVTGAVDTAWNARNVMATGRIKTAVLFTDDQTTVANARLLGFDVTLIAQGATRTLAVTNRNGTIATDANIAVNNAGDVVTYNGSVVLA